MLSGGFLPAVKTGAMDTRWQTEAGPRAPDPLLAAASPRAEGVQKGITEGLCFHLRVSGASLASPERPSLLLSGSVPLGPDDGDASLSVCPAGHSFPVRLPGRQEELGLEDGRLHGHASPCPLRAGASHWSWGDPHDPSETKRRLLWN